MKKSKHDVIVIGAGHAGIEAAHIAARMGASVLLITGHVDLIGQMSCNPAIGGVAKGNIVREIDALGGVMGRLIDRAGIHFRMLNAGKGSAVWGPRAQADRVLYRSLARAALEDNPNIAILQAAVARIDVAGAGTSNIGAPSIANRESSLNNCSPDAGIIGGGAAGSSPPALLAVLDNGERISAGAVVIAAGTFLNGMLHVGLHSRPGGRAGEPPACGLTESLAALGIASGRLKTGTPPRIDGRTVDYSRVTEQPGDTQPWPFSFFTREKLTNKIVCWSTKTNDTTHKHVRDNLDRSPLFTGKIKSAGPRYCPSIEDKVIRFGDRDGHMLYLEPDSLETRELYLNGLSTSLPYDAQERMVASIPGLEHARILRPGYGIEYDYFRPTQLKPTLESKIVPRLFFAGQVNGTSGYEEAACQGLVAGINAALALRGGEPLVLGRDTSYIGVLIDDLVTKGTDEPYRMFTSRAEYRMLLRQDNCDERLMPIAYKLGTVTREQYDERRRFWDRKREFTERLFETKAAPEAYRRLTGREITQAEKAGDLLRRPEVRIEEILPLLVDNAETQDCGLPECEQHVDSAGCQQGDGGAAARFDRALLLGAESDIKYEGFVRKQAKEIERLRKYEETEIPPGFSYDDLPGLLNESRQKLKAIRPNTLGQASRIGGVTPADVLAVAVRLSKTGRDSPREP